MRRLLTSVALVGALLLAFAASAPASAAPDQAHPIKRAALAPAVKHKKKAQPKVHVKRGPAITLGVSSADAGLLGSGATSNPWVARAQSLGVQMVRISVYWRSIAPATEPAGFDASDPGSSGYRWTALDQEIRALSAEGLAVMLTIYDAPTWAEGASQPSWAPAGTWEPNAADFGQFAEAIATRYDGHFPDPLNPGQDLPAVTYWQAWNEPNMSVYLTPQYADEGPVKYKNGSGCPVTDTSAALSPGIYRSLLNAFYQSVKSVSASNYVAMAGTAPYSAPNCQPGLDNYRISPVTFDQDVFCLDSSNQPAQGCSTPAYLDAIDSHPYAPPNVPGPCGNTLCSPTWNAPTGDVAVPDVHELRTTLSAAIRAGTVLPARIKGVWATELGWDTSPTDPNGETPATEARWLEQAFYLLWKQGVSTILWWKLADSASFGGWPDASGEFTAGGAAKPSATAYRFPFLTNRANKSTVSVWGRAPKAGTLRVERRAGQGWKTVVRFHVAAREVFQLNLAQKTGATFRAQVGGVTSLTWKQAKSVQTS